MTANTQSPRPSKAGAPGANAICRPCPSLVRQLWSALHKAEEEQLVFLTTSELANRYKPLVDTLTDNIDDPNHSWCVPVPKVHSAAEELVKGGIRTDGVARLSARAAIASEALV